MLTAPLSDYLNHCDARALWSATAAHGLRITAYAIRSTTVIILTYPNGGWDAYVPAHPGRDIAGTLSALSQIA